MHARLETFLLDQRGMLIGWVPVCLGIGIGIYFGLRIEPDKGALIILACAAVFLAGCSRLVSVAYAPLVLGLALILAGFGAAKLRTEVVAGPLIDFRYYGPIVGRIVGMDRSASDARRITLDQVVLARTPPDRTPLRVRVSLHGDQPIDVFRAGETIMMTGHLSPPAGPAEPGGFNFQRHAWFLQLGAVGYTRTPVLRIKAADPGSFSARIFALRMQVSQAVQAALPRPTGAFAAAIMTGDRSGMQQEVLEDLRAANLAHLLAISGLHMGLLTGFVFAVVRSGLALVPWVALRYPTKKVAACVALCVGGFYLALSGGSVATERAYIMVAVMLVAVLLGRRALTLRAVAIAAILILLWQPEAMIGPGFQMSFAATTALVVVFGALRRVDQSHLPRWLRPVLSVFISSLVAGLATAPFAAAYFNQISHYGLIANLLSVPLMGVLVMPAAVLAACLTPFGLAEIGLWLMDLGLWWILLVADTVSGWEGALSHVKAPGPPVLPLFTLAVIAIILVQGRLRWLGVGGVAAALFLWLQTPRPDLLVADNGSLIGVLGPDGRALSKPRGGGFVAGIWLENDGGPVEQAVAAGRRGITVEGRVATSRIGDWEVVQVSGKTALAGLNGCGGADVLISNQEIEAQMPCEVFDLIRLRQTGALALNSDQQGHLIITTAQGSSGYRRWSNLSKPVTAQIILEGSEDRPDQ